MPGCGYRTVPGIIDYTWYMQLCRLLALGSKPVGYRWQFPIFAYVIVLGCRNRDQVDYIDYHTAVRMAVFSHQPSVPIAIISQ